MIKSPFFVVEDAISPSRCESLIKQLGIQVPSVGENGKPLKHERIMKGEAFNEDIAAAITRAQSEIEQYYGGIIDSPEPAMFQQYFENPVDPCEIHGCESSKFLRKKWVKVKDIDLVGFIWLKDYNGGVPLDPAFEVYGGKLEFPAYDFSLVPQRGTMVLYPAGPHFITAISPILLGSLEQVKITLRIRMPDGGLYVYQPSEFPGTYQEWFTPQE